MSIQMLKRGSLIAGLLTALFVLGGCETKTTTKTEVNDKLLGGQEVKKTEVTEQGDKVQVKETKIETDSSGNVEKKEIEVKGDNIK